MALIELQTGRPEAATRHLEKAVGQQPESADLHNLLGGALKRAGRLEEAVLAYDKAVSLGPELAEAHYNLGNAGNSFGVPFFMSPVSVIHPVHSS
jgi:Flp pilus assembly protein TadD